MSGKPHGKLVEWTPTTLSPDWDELSHAEELYLDTLALRLTAVVSVEDEQALRWPLDRWDDLRYGRPAHAA